MNHELVSKVQAEFMGVPFVAERLKHYRPVFYRQVCWPAHLRTPSMKTYRDARRADGYVDWPVATVCILVFEGHMQDEGQGSSTGFHIWARGISMKAAGDRANWGKARADAYRRAVRALMGKDYWADVKATVLPDKYKELAQQDGWTPDNPSGLARYSWHALWTEFEQTRSERLVHKLIDAVYDMTAGTNGLILQYLTDQFGETSRKLTKRIRGKIKPGPEGQGARVHQIVVNQYQLAWAPPVEATSAEGYFNPSVFEQRLLDRLPGMIKAEKKAAEEAAKKAKTY